MLNRVSVNTILKSVIATLAAAVVVSGVNAILGVS